jgi:hypothetical protein
LSDEDLDRVEGRREELAGLIQERYGRTREEAARSVDEWLERTGATVAEDESLPDFHLPEDFVSNEDLELSMNRVAFDSAQRVNEILEATDRRLDRLGGNPEAGEWG